MWDKCRNFHLKLGILFVLSSLWISIRIWAATAGINAAGTTAYPKGGMALGLPFTGFKNEDYPWCGFVNAAGTRAWIGMNTTFRGGILSNITLPYKGMVVPGVIIAFDLATMRKVGSLELAPDERGVIEAVGDPTSTYGYFLVDSTPSRIVKVNLPTMSRVGHLDLQPGESAGCFIADKTGTYGYIGLRGNQARILKIRLNNLERSSVLDLPSVDANLTEAELDPAGEYAYFVGENSSTNRLVRIRLADFSRVNAHHLAEGIVTDIAVDIINPARVYVGLYVRGTSPQQPTFVGKICRVNFEEFTLDTLEIQNLPILTINLNANGSHALVGVGNVFRLLDVNQFTFGPATDSLANVLIYRVLTVSHSPETFLILNPLTPGQLVKVALENTTITRGEQIWLDGGESYYWCMTLDEDQRYLYVGNPTEKISKLDLNRRKRVAAAQLKDNHTYFRRIPFVQSITAGGGQITLGDYFDTIGESAYKRVDASTMQFLGQSMDSLASKVEELKIHPYDGQIYALISGVNSSIGVVDSSLVYAPWFTLPNIKLRSLTPDTNQYGFYYINEPSSLVAYFNNNGPQKYSDPQLGGPKSIMRGSNGQIFTVTGNSVYEINPQTLAYIRSQDLRTLTGIDSLTLNGGISNFEATTGLYYGHHGSGDDQKEILMRHNLNTFDGAVIFEPPYRVDQALCNNEFTQAVGLHRASQQGISGSETEPLLRIQLTPRERMEGTRFKLNETAEINSVNFYSHAAVGPRRVEVLPTGYEQKLYSGAFFDRAHSRIWYGTRTSPGTYVCFNTVTREITTTRSLQVGEDNLNCGACDLSGTYGYFGTGTSPGKVIKIRLADGARIGALTLESGENSLTAAAVDAQGTFAYFATDTAPGKIIKIRLSNFTREGALTLNAAEPGADALVIDPARPFMYASSGFQSARIVKINLGDFTRVTALNLNGNGVLGLAVDATGDYLYAAKHFIQFLGGVDDPGVIDRIRLSDFTKTDPGLTLNDNERRPQWLAIDPNGQYLLVTCDGPVTKVVKIDLLTFTRQSGTFLRNLEPNATSIFTGADGKYAFLGLYTTPGRIVTYEPNPKPLRLAIYRDLGASQSRVWQSGELEVKQADTWTSVPVSQGTPTSLKLFAGDYTLAWQSDADESVPSFTPGNPSDGIQIPMEYGPFDDSITTWTTTASRWSMYLDYTSRNTARDWQGLQ